MITIDLTEMPGGARYEDRYGAWIKVFESIALTPRDEHILVRKAPWSWHALLRYLRCETMGGQTFFPQDRLAAAAVAEWRCDDRHQLEVLCSLRPETVDALWKCDAQWHTPRTVTMTREQTFPVTCNGSFWRREVMEYATALAGYVPTKRKVVLVPCAADKPYPARLHQAVLDLLPDDWYVANVTGVLGLVPMDLWAAMPHYDSGIPNEWRAQQTVSFYFGLHQHERVVSYSDFYSVPIANGMRLCGHACEFAVDPRFYPDYLPLHEPMYLERLRRTIGEQR